MPARSTTSASLSAGVPGGHERRQARGSEAASASRDEAHSARRVRKLDSGRGLGTMSGRRTGSLACFVEAACGEVCVILSFV